MIAVVAVDGPAGAGKSSASRGLAARLGFAYVDTGAMYRAVGVLADEAGVSLEDDAALATLCAGLTFAAAGERTVVGGRDLSAAIRSERAGDLASRVSTRPVVRQCLVALQRAMGASGRVVMEGRDIGTVVFPDAAVKLFLTADPAVRAHRRARELRERGEAVDEGALAAEIAARDRRDANRPTAPLRAAPDAVVVDTSGLPLDAVVAAMERIVRTRIGGDS
jgi:cytidylate kinase